VLVAALVVAVGTGLYVSYYLDVASRAA